MNHFLIHTKSRNQYLVSLATISTVAMACMFARDFVDYKVVGYLLLVTVSLLAIFLDIIPVLVAAMMSALILDFLFIRPYYTFHINSAEDALLLLLFFVISLVNAVLTYKIRRAEKSAQTKEAKWNTMQLYNTLLDSLSHELRTPISTIMGAVGTLQNKSAQLSETNQVKLLAEMEKASMRLNHQVENLLNMSRLESGFIEPKLDWVDINELVYNVLDSLDQELSSHKVVVKKNDYLPLFKLDYGLTEQMIYNLVYNATQYTPIDATIEIILEYKPEVDFEFNDGRQVTCLITVSDDGPGFPEAEINKAFDKFHRLRHSKTGGTGLGLSIVKGFAEAQNGTVRLSNNKAGGAAFSILFPAEVIQTKDIGNE